MDLKPKNAVSITECDVNLEFDAPEGYVEPVYKPSGSSNGLAGSSKSLQQNIQMPEAPLVVPILKEIKSAFVGAGQRLDGKKGNSSNSQTRPSTSLHACAAEENSPSCEMIPDVDYRPGTLRFVRYNYKNFHKLESEKKEIESAGNGSGTSGGVAFSGSAKTIRNG